MELNSMTPNRMTLNRVTLNRMPLNRMAPNIMKIRRISIDTTFSKLKFISMPDSHVNGTQQIVMA